MSKRFLLVGISAAIVFAVITAFFLSPRFIISCAQKQIAGVFPGSRVSVGGFSLKGIDGVQFSDISIIREGIYSCSIKTVIVKYSFASLFTKIIPEISVDYPSLTVSAPQDTLQDLQRYIRQSPKRSFLIEAIEIAGASVKLETKDAGFDGMFSIFVKLPGKSLDSFHAEIKRASFGEAHVLNAVITAGEKHSSGEITVEKVWSGTKISVKDIRGPVRLKNNILFLSPLTAHYLGGTVTLDLKMNCNAGFDYLLNGRVSGIDLAEVTEVFELDSKLRLTGKVSGDFGLRGRGAEIGFISGNFSVAEPGGTLVITEKKFLEAIAAHTQQSLAFVTEGFQNYQYGVGTAVVSVQAGDLVFEAAMDGGKGKRNLRVVLHDLNAWLKNTLRALESKAR